MIIKAMQQCNIKESEYPVVGDTMLRIIIMEISGKPVTIEYKSILGILNMAAVVVKLLEELKDASLRDSDVSSIVRMYRAASAN